MMIEDLSLAAFKSGLEDEKFVVVDVREADEFAAGRVPGAILNPLSRFSVGELPAGKRVVIMCRSGQRSKVAIAIAQAAGRQDVTGHYPGGMLEWTAAGEPVER